MYCFKCGNQIPDIDIRKKVSTETESSPDEHIYHITIESIHQLSPGNPPQKSEFNCTVLLCGHNTEDVSTNSQSSSNSPNKDRFKCMFAVLAVLYFLLSLVTIFVPGSSDLVYPVISILSLTFYLMTTCNKNNWRYRMPLVAILCSLLILYLLFCFYVLFPTTPISKLKYLVSVGNAASVVSLIAFFLDFVFNHTNLSSKSNKAKP